MLNQQLYENKPVRLRDVQGASSRTIYIFMKFGPEEVEDKVFPYDVDDYERNRALLICYPEWKLRIKEMESVSRYWKALVHNWDEIERKYDEDYKKYGYKINDIGECDLFIKKLYRSVQSACWEII